MKLFGQLKLDFEPNHLLEAYASLIKTVPFDELTNQISLRFRPGTEQTQFYRDGIGTLYNYDTQKFLASEGDFTEFSEEVKKSYFYEVFKKVDESVPFEIGRVRLMRLLPKRCYSMHQDCNIRLHIPIVNNGKSYFVFKDSGAVSLSDPDKFYWLNTLAHHSAMNGCSNEERIHLVFSTGGDQSEQIKLLQWLEANSLNS